MGLILALLLLLPSAAWGRVMVDHSTKAWLCNAEVILWGDSEFTRLTAQESELVAITTSCPSHYAGQRCYEKWKIPADGDKFKVRITTVVSQCTYEGHRWIKKELSNLCMGECSYFVCKVCSEHRKYKRIKREIEESIPDDGPLDQVDCLVY